MKSSFAKALVLVVVVFLLLKFAIRPPLPSSLFWMYLGLIVVAILVHFSVEDERFREFIDPIKSILSDDDKGRMRTILFTAFPLLVAFMVFSKYSSSRQPPAGLRTIHPAPPNQMEFRGKKITLAEFENPFRHLQKSDSEAFRQRVEAGGRIYYQNCHYCHGDKLAGEGHFAHGFDPPPADFTDPGTIAMLQESFLFWRISKGGPGLPKISAPWSSAMPVWEDYLTEDEIWEVILFLYDQTGWEPRTWEEAEE